MITIKRGKSLGMRYVRYSVPLVLFILVGYLLLYLTYENVKHEMIDSLNARQMVHARQAAIGIETFFNDHVKMLSLLAKNGHIVDLDRTGVMMMRDYQAAHSEEISIITRIDREGRVLHPEPYDARVVGRPVTTMDDFREVRRTAGIVVSDVFTNLRGVKTIIVHTPVFRKGAFDGTLALLFPFEFIAKRYVEGVRIGNEGYAWVISRGGVELSCPVPGHAGKSVFDNCKDFPDILAMAERMIRGEQGTATYEFDRIRGNEVDKLTKQAVFLPIRLGNNFWSIVVATPEQEALGALQGFRNRLVLLALLFVIGIGYFSYLIFRAGILSEEMERRTTAEEELRRNRESAEKLASETVVIADIGRIIGSTLDIDQVYERFAAEVRKLISFDRIGVNLCNVRQNTVAITYVSGEDSPRLKQGAILPLAGTLSEKVLRERTGLILQPGNIDEITRELPALAQTFQTGLRSLICVPLFSRDEVIGTLHIRSKRPDAYVERDLRLAERVGTQIAGAIANAQLFRELQETERSLRESEGRFRTLFEQAAVGVAEIEPETGRFLTVNRRLCEMVGRTEEEMLATAFHAITHPEDRSIDLEKRTQMLTGKIGHYTREKRYLRKDGGIIWVNLTISHLWEPGGQRERNMLVVEEITHRKRMDEERQKLEERLKRAEKMETLGQLAGGIAHDLNNILGVLVGYSELLQEKIEEPSPLRRYVDSILQSGIRAAAIIQDLLTMARRGVSVSEAVNFNRLVEAYMRSPEFEAVRAHHPLVTYRTDLGKDLINILGSQVHLTKAITNLVSNASEAIAGRGEVTIRTENRYMDQPIQGYDHIDEGDYIAFTVSDTGKGISPEDLGKIFEPFYTKKVMGRSGTGLGLTVVWGTVKDHRGYIDVKSEEGTGSHFTLYFPVTREEIAEERKGAPPETLQCRGESVLVVDDVKEQRELAVSMLTRLDCRVSAVSSGEEALEYVRTNRVDLIVLDMIMDPGMDGLETYRRILEIRPGQKAIIVSGFSETEKVREAQALGAGAYVRKPYMLEKIGLAIRQELDKG